MLHTDSYFFGEFPASIPVVCGCNSDMPVNSDLVFKALSFRKFVVSSEHDTVALNEVCLSKAIIKVWSFIRLIITAS